MNAPGDKLIPSGETAPPPEFLQRVRRAVLDKFTGNVQLNIHRGEIIGFRVEEVVNLKPPSR